ncbi:hypothetical protein ScPMuIL_012978 [Solemya velum]
MPCAVVESEEELQNLIEKIELDQGVKFVKHRQQHPTTTSLRSLQGHKIRFEEKHHVSSSLQSIGYDGVPYIVENNYTLECHQGSQHAKSVIEAGNEGDHIYDSRRPKMLRTSKKQNCPAKIKIRRIIKFPEYKVEGPRTDRKLRFLSSELRRNYSEETSIRKYVFSVYLPSEEEHRNHLLGQISTFHLPIDKRIIKKIKDLALEGHRNKVTGVFIQQTKTSERISTKQWWDQNHLNEETLKKIINHVKEITSCSKVDCKEEEHQRHHGYLKQPIGIHRKCMKRCGFGLSQFPQKFIESLGENLISRLVVNLYKDKRKPYTGGRYSTLKGLVENSHLGKMLYEKKTFAVHYVMDVLLNEGLIYIYRQQSNLEYTEAQEHLSSSEVVLK